MSNNKTLEQIASEYALNKFPVLNIQTTDEFTQDVNFARRMSHNQSFQDGFNASTAIHQERTKKLIEALSDWLDDTEQEMNHQPGWKSVKQALQELGDDEKKEI